MTEVQEQKVSTEQLNELEGNYAFQVFIEELTGLREANLRGLLNPFLTGEGGKVVGLVPSEALHLYQGEIKGLDHALSWVGKVKEGHKIEKMQQAFKEEA